MMTRSIRRQVMIAAVLLAGGSVHAAAIDDARTAFDAKDYRSALASISAALAQQPALANEARSDLFLLRGESLLRLKSRGGAIEAFGAAERATADTKKSAAAAATQLLIEDSAGFVYTSPRGGKTFDVREPASRTQAFAAMFADRFEEIKPAAYREGAGATLDALLPLMPELSNAHVLEVAATGKDEVTRPLLAKLSDQALKLTGDELSRLEQRAELIAVQATDATLFAEGGDLSVSAREFTVRQRDELADLSQRARKLAVFSSKLRAAAVRTAGAADAWARLATNAADLLARIEQIRSRG